MPEQSESSRLIAEAREDLEAISRMLGLPPFPGKPAPTPAKGSLYLIVDNERKAA